jgi:hypothetical protein
VQRPIRWAAGIAGLIRPDAVVAGNPAKPAPCKIANSHVKLVTTLNRFAKAVELASYDMQTNFCYDGSSVWKPGMRSFPPAEAGIQNVRYTTLGTLYQTEYIAPAGPSVTGWAPWNDNEKGSFFTRATTLWKAGLPLVKWAIPERDSVTKTQTVFADGTVRLD